MFDKGDMEDVLVNLSINAMHAMPDGGVLTIHTENVVVSPEQAQMHNLKAGDYVHLSVTDTGIGMDEKIRNQIFDPFFTTKDDIGTGLGLSQVYGFIQRAGGSINVYSEKGHGSSFSMFFPRFIDNDKEKINESESLNKPLYGHGELILLVDDEPSLLALGEEILTLNGYQVLRAENAKSALDILANNQNENEKIVLMVSDVIMPETDGYQLSRTVAYLYPDIKIQLASGFNDDRHLQYMDDSLHETILTKPFTPDELLIRVRALLDEKS